MTGHWGAANGERRLAILEAEIKTVDFYQDSASEIFCKAVTLFTFFASQIY